MCISYCFAFSNKHWYERQGPHFHFLHNKHMFFHMTFTAPIQFWLLSKLPTRESVNRYIFTLLGTLTCG